MTKHTPGPWKNDFKKFGEVRAENGALVAKCKKLTNLVNLQANARLIAAAPELLEALSMAMTLLDMHVKPEHPVFVRAFSAIAKATKG